MSSFIQVPAAFNIIAEILNRYVDLKKKLDPQKIETNQPHVSKLLM